MHSRRFLPRAILGLVALACCGAAAAKGLYPTQFIDTLNSPAAVVMADVNGDGKMDIVEIGSDQTIAVLLGKGDGTFDPPNAYYVTGTAATPEALVVADVNGDGKPDIIVVNNAIATVSVLLGNGDGTFKAQTAAEAAAGKGTPAPSYPVGNGVISVAVADLDGDGFGDIVTADFTDNTVSILMNKGNGTFKPRTTVLVGNGPDYVTTADMNKDGKPDILVSDSNDNGFTELLGNGDGTFQLQPEISVSAKPAQATLQMLVVGDFNNDGNLDVISTNTDPNSNVVMYYPGKGDGSFGPPRAIVTGLDTLYLQVARLNGPGSALCLMAGSAASSTLNVMLGNGTGGFTTGTQYPAPGLTTGLTVQSFAAADVTSDGKPDIVVVNSTGGFMQVMFNDGTAHFHLQNSYDLGSVPSDVQTADLNGDGHKDIVETNSADGSVGVLLGNGDGTFQKMVSYRVGSHPQRLMLADVNGDGILDAVTANNGDNTVSVLIGNGDGTFQAARNFSAGPNPVDVAVADMDRDGKKDIIVGNATVNTVSILRGNGSGGFAAPVSYPAGSQINGLAVGDVNHDGFPDVVTVGGNVAVLLNDGKGALIPVVLNKNGLSVYSYAAIGNRITLRDVNNDGNLDMLISDYSNSELTVLLGNHFGFFTRSALVSPTCANPGNLAVADLNDDGNLDVVMSCVGSSTIGVLLGDGQGSFISNSFASEIDPRGVAIGDFNEDGQPDVAVINGGSDNMNVLLQIPGIVAHDRKPVTASMPFAVPDSINPVDGSFLASDPDGDALTFVIVEQPAEGTVTYVASTGDFSYQANPGFVGRDTMTFEVSDGVKVSNVSAVNITVSGSSGSSKSRLGAIPLPLLPLLGLFALLRRRRRD